MSDNDRVIPLSQADKDAMTVEDLEDMTLTFDESHNKGDNAPKEETK